MTMELLVSERLSAARSTAANGSSDNGAMPIDAMIADERAQRAEELAQEAPKKAAAEVK